MATYDLWSKEVKLGIPKNNFPTDEELKALEDTMPDCQHGWFSSKAEGESLHYRYVLPSNNKPKALIIFHHGVHSQSGKAWVLKDGTKLNFALCIDYFVKEKGYALYGLDALGHGFSTGSRMFIPDWKINRDDLVGFASHISKQHDDEVPFFLMGESYGGCLCLHAANELEGEKSFAGICLTAPAIIGDIPAPPVTFVLKNMLAPRFPKWTPFFMPNPVTPDRIWNDPEVLALNTDKQFKKTGLDKSGEPFQLGTAVQLLLALQQVQKTTIPKLKTPFCCIHGTSDYGVPISGTDYLEEKAVTPKEDQAILRVEGGYHDLLGSREFSKVGVEFMGKFIEERLKKM
eukprot:CAMPEP_0202442534 /NCGR_PEP_ID=MMETSP1360-20130828/1965_1 /ASSEMBLY_ACC=CAM_ASM_000848 /TAXON_ID=515479 /ORGANISM="Licmophora paradoxa, Strain CCMP2313" /LENGTH=344 /DNA_ID=CAMNT_0049057929 /DNA_START=62 /DNA_END=1096 /DNA_ORIENTATION=-